MMEICNTAGRTPEEEHVSSASSKCSSRRQVASNAPSYNPKTASTTTAMPS